VLKTNVGPFARQDNSTGLPIEGKGVRSQLCKAPYGPFRQLTPDPFTSDRYKVLDAVSTVRFALF